MSGSWAVHSDRTSSLAASVAWVKTYLFQFVSGRRCSCVCIVVGPFVHSRVLCVSEACCPRTGRTSREEPPRFCGNKYSTTEQRTSQAIFARTGIVPGSDETKKRMKRTIESCLRSVEPGPLHRFLCPGLLVSSPLPCHGSLFCSPQKNKT